jgi:hypothetical protein
MCTQCSTSDSVPILTDQDVLGQVRGETLGCGLIASWCDHGSICNQAPYSITN